MTRYSCYLLLLGYRLSDKWNIVRAVRIVFNMNGSHLNNVCVLRYIRTSQRQEISFPAFSLVCRLTVNSGNPVDFGSATRCVVFFTTGKRQFFDSFLRDFSRYRMFQNGAKGRGCVHGKCFVSEAVYRLALIESSVSRK